MRLVFLVFTLLAICSPPLVFPHLARAQSGDFTFKTVKPPAPGTKPEIDIFIDRTWPYRDAEPPQEQEATQSADADAPFGWFWERVGDSLLDAGPDRADAAIEILRAAPEAAPLRPDTGVLNAIVAEHGLHILAGSAGRRLSPALIMAMISVESSGRSDAVSPKGAAGLMQLMPATAERFGVTDRSDPTASISGGAAYLELLLDMFKGDLVMALAAYNAGESSILEHSGVPPFAETRGFVPKVLAAWDRARLYCQTLPRYVDDGCLIAIHPARH